MNDYDYAWEIVGNIIVHNNFKHDVGISITGDFGENKTKNDWLEYICSKLNTQNCEFLESENKRLHDILAYLGDCDEPVVRALEEAGALSGDYCKKQQKYRENLRAEIKELEEQIRQLTECLNRMLYVFIQKF